MKIWFFFFLRFYKLTVSLIQIKEVSFYEIGYLAWPKEGRFQKTRENEVGVIDKQNVYYFFKAWLVI